MSQTSANRVKDLLAKYKKVIPPRCIISGHSVEGELIVAHILPHGMDARIQRIVGMVKKINNLWNLMWPRSSIRPKAAFLGACQRFDPNCVQGAGMGKGHT
jgi:hypothetical protein